MLRLVRLLKGLCGPACCSWLGQVLTALAWAVLDSKEAVLDRLSVLLLQLVLAFLVAACLLYLASLRLLAWRRGQGGEAADGADVTRDVRKNWVRKHLQAPPSLHSPAGSRRLRAHRTAGPSPLAEEECEGDASQCQHQCQVSLLQHDDPRQSHSMVLLPCWSSSSTTLLLPCWLLHDRAADHTPAGSFGLPCTLERELLHEKTVAARLLQATTVTCTTQGLLLLLVSSLY